MREVKFTVKIFGSSPNWRIEKEGEFLADGYFVDGKIEIDALADESVSSELVRALVNDAMVNL